MRQQWGAGAIVSTGSPLTPALHPPACPPLPRSSLTTPVTSSQRSSPTIPRSSCRRTTLAGELPPPRLSLGMPCLLSHHLGATIEIKVLCGELRRGWGVLRIHVPCYRPWAAEWAPPPHVARPVPASAYRTRHPVLVSAANTSCPPTCARAAAPHRSPTLPPPPQNAPQGDHRSPHPRRRPAPG
jgi:hypothetical protein